MNSLSTPLFNATWNILLTLTIFLLSGHSEATSVISAQFTLTPDYLEQFKAPASVPIIEERVVKNLLEWRFPVHVGPKSGQTHRLEALLGAIAEDKTPIGFSYSSGNSDPRAPDFQKARVLPVTCRLISLDDTKPSRETKLTFSSETLPNSAKLETQLVEHISTTCFKLLDDLKLQQSEPQGATTVKSPAWLPSLRIETLPVKTVKAADSKEKVAPSTPQTTEAPSEAPEVTDETPKQIIIHNQGSPVTLKLGHDRL